MAPNSARGAKSPLTRRSSMNNMNKDALEKRPLRMEPSLMDVELNSVCINEEDTNNLLSEQCIPSNLGCPDSAAAGALQSQDDESAFRKEIVNAANGGMRSYVRDIILGVNDGLVSTFLLVLGVVGGGMAAEFVLLTGIASSLAGAISMAFGEYLATKSQNDMDKARKQRRSETNVNELQYHRVGNLEEVREVLKTFNLHGKVLDDAVEQIGSDDNGLANFLDVVEGSGAQVDERSEWTAMLLSGCLFMAGSIPSILPFVFTNNVELGLILAAVLASLSFVIVGVLKAWVTGSNVFLSGLENLVVGLLGASLSYGIGSLYRFMVPGGIGAACVG